MTESEARGLAGVHAAVVTPMSTGGERVDLGCIGPLLDYLGKRGMHGALVLGSTGEYASLTQKEKIEVLGEAASTLGGMKLIAGCGGTALPDVMELIETAERKGADALLVPPPFYFRNASPAGIEAFFAAVLERATKPVILYHIPPLTGLPLDRKMLERLAERYPILWGIKDSGGKIQETNRFIQSKPGRVFFGSDSMALEGLKAGATGLISACANVVPELLRKIYDKALRREDATSDQEYLTKIRQSLRPFPLQAAIKRLLKFKGIDAGQVRLPLLNLTAHEEDEVVKIAVIYS